MSMDDYDIDLFLTETNAHDSSLYREPPILCFDKETMPDLMGSKISISSPKPSSHMKTLPFTNSHMPSFMATPSLPPASSTVDLVNNIGLGPTDPFETIDQAPIYFTSKNFIAEQSLHAFISQKFPMNPKEPPPSAYFQSHHKDPTDLVNLEEQLSSEQLPLFYFSRQNLLLNPEWRPPLGEVAIKNILSNNEQLNSSSGHYPRMSTKEKYQLPGDFLPPSYINVKYQSPKMPYRPFQLNSNFANAMDDLLSHDWEAVSSFLAGQVRPGPDVIRIYKCSECTLEFPNAQAFGGHMSSHSKDKRRKNSTVTIGGNSKRSKHCSIEASSTHSSKTKPIKNASVTRGETTRMKSAGKENGENEGIQKEHSQVAQENMSGESI